MKRVLTYGTYDVLHYGHINLLKRAKALGDYLIVALSSDEFNAIKNKKSYYTYEQRKMILEACRYVDLVIPENDWEQKISDVQKYQADVFVMGETPLHKTVETLDKIHLRADEIFGNAITDTLHEAMGGPTAVSLWARSPAATALLCPRRCAVWL